MNKSPALVHVSRWAAITASLGAVFACSSSPDVPAGADDDPAGASAEPQDTTEAALISTGRRPKVGRYCGLSCPAGMKQGNTYCGSSSLDSTGKKTVKCSGFPCSKYSPNSIYCHY